MKLNKIVFIPLLLGVLSGCSINSTEANSSLWFKPLDVSNEAIDNAYYSGIKKNVFGPQLLLSLHNLMIDTHTTYYKYGDTRDSKYIRLLDMNPDKPGSLLNLYTSKSVSSYGTREHVWPCANSNKLWGREDNKDIGEDYIGGGSDFYHVRNCDSKVNSARNNYRFTEFSEEDSYTLSSDGGPYSLRVSSSAHRAEPADEWKGDLARIICYVYIHYGINYGHTNEYCGSLALSDVMYMPSGESIEYVQQRLCDWNRLDPVSEQEKLRNDNVQALQGNRNPFVDYPDLMERMFNIEYE